MSRAASRNPVFAWQIAGFAVIAALVIAIGVTVVGAIADRPAPRAAVTLTEAPKIATANGGLRLGDMSAPVTVAVYLDYLCPYCGRFEKANGDDLQKLVDEGRAAVELHPLAILDRLSNGTAYSSRAANAAAVVADRAPARLLRFGAALYARQPAEGSDGLTDAQIAEIATGAGVPREVAASFAAGEFKDWVAAATAKAGADGVESTPTILVNGAPMTGDPLTAGQLRTAVEKAAGK